MEQQPGYRKSLRRQELSADETRIDVSLSSSEDVPDPEMEVGGQDALDRSLPTVGIPLREDNSHVLLSYRGHKVTSFEVKGRRLICLPQAFDLFLKDLIGGLHTVYTKLRRLGVKPVVCSVDQVRILRILGAIRSGVNRCKMISPTEFDLLYDDCTNSRIRPGRPLKRSTQLRTAPNEDSENLMKTASYPKLCFHDARQIRTQTIVEDPKLAIPVTSFPVRLLAWSDVWRRSPASALFPAADALESRCPLDHHPLYWRAREDIPSSTYLGMLRDSEWKPRGPFFSHPSTDPLEIRCRENHSGALRPIHDDEVNEPLNLEVRGRARDQDLLTAVEQSTKENLRKEQKISTAEETTCNSRQSSDNDRPTLMDAVSTNRRTTPTGDCFANCVAAHAPPVDCSHDSPSEKQCSVESLLKDVLELVRMAARNCEQRERLISCEKEHLEMQAAKEMELRREVERKLATEKKNRVALQRKLRMEKRVIRRLQTKFSAEDNTDKTSAIQVPVLHQMEPTTSFQHDA